MKRILVLLVLCVSGLSAHAKENADVIKIVTVTPIVIGETKDVTATFTGLNTQAREAGLADAQLHGSIRYKEAVKGKRATIYWDSIKWQRGTNATEGGLDNPLVSKFVTADERVEPQTSLTAKGDLSALTASFDNVKQRAAQAQRETAEKVAQVVGEKTPAASGVSGGYVPGSGTGVDPGAGSYGDTGVSGKDGVAVDPVSTTWETCPPRVAQIEGLVYRQAKEIKKNSAGDVLNEGECKDHGGTVPIQRDYESCSANFDFENRKMYSQYKEIAEIDGMIMTISGCTIDLEKSTDLQATFEGCDVRHDFTNGVSVQLEQLYYRDDQNKVVKVGDCQDSSHSYAHYKTGQTCSDEVDFANGYVIPYQRIAYNLDDGTVQYATECMAQSTTGIEIQEEVCDPKYEHDFIANVSYLRTQQYYTDLTGETVILSECQRTTTSYTHKFNDSLCGVTHDDDALMTYWNAKRYIEAPEGNVVISDCEQYSSPTPYVFSGYRQKSKIQKVFKRTSFYTTFKGKDLLEGIDRSDPLYGCKSHYTFKKRVGLDYLCNAPIVDACVDDNEEFRSFTVSEPDFNGNCRITARYNPRRRFVTEYMDYLRGDGSIYKKPIKHNYILEPDL